MKDANIYSDLDLAFKPHPLTGDLIPKRNIDAIRRSIKTVFTLEAFDIPFEPKKHASIKRMLFQPASHLSEMEIRTHLEWAIKKLEPRANLKNIEVEASSDGTGYNISIWYNIRSLMIEDNFNFFVERVR